MSKKIILLIISITVVIAILAGTSYAVLFKTNETDEQAYTTGMLEITSETTNDSVTLSNSLPMNDTDGLALTPYTFKITNTGNLTYKFDVKLLATNTTNLISSEYIKVSINGVDAKKLSELTDGIILSDQTLYSGESIDVSLRVWLDEYTLNTELGKQFYGKVTTEGQAIYTDAPSLATLKNLGLDDELNETRLTTFTTTSKLDGTTGIYAADDDLGTSYYFRGNVTNNYVKFGKNASGQDMYWRIIRINGDGTIRMIYDGTQAYANNRATKDNIVGTSAYNTNYADNSFVGYMNGTVDGTNFPSGGTNSTSYNEAHTNRTNSTIKTYLDNWYKTNIVDTGYSTSVADAIYCNDRVPGTDETINGMLGATGEGFGTYVTTYSLYNRMSLSNEGMPESFSPTLLCEREEDKFTVSEDLGNGDLTYPVGLITVDEMVYGGLYLYMDENSTNDESYLFEAGNYYWTMSPVSSNFGIAFVAVGADGAVGDGDPGVRDSDFGVRPVITLSSSAIKSGNGSASKPFSIEEPSLTTLTNLGLTSSVEETDLTTFTTTSKLDGTTGIYAAKDDLGTSYYFRGNVTNNYVKFGKNASGQDMYWRIIRINGDGTIRMIYDGTQAYANNATTKDNIVGTSVYNTNYADNAFVGYMNGTTDGTNFPSGGTNSTSYDEAHANTTDSTIKTYLDNWYKTNIVDTGYSGKVVDAIYCNDRTRVIDETFNTMMGITGEGFGTYNTAYSLYARMKLTSDGMPESFTPTLKCNQVNDRFTLNTDLGNGKMTHPVGLLTIDEMIYGGLYLYMDETSVNDESYLFEAGNYYWTMSPGGFGDGNAGVFVGSGGAIGGDGVSVSGSGVRPVITLSSSAITGGTGISTDPYVTS